MCESDQTSPDVPNATLPDVAIVDVRCRVYRAPIASDVAMSFGALGHRIMFLVDLVFDDGAVTTGETWINYPSWGWRERIATVEEGIRPLLVGRRFAGTREPRDLLLGTLAPIARQWGAVGPVFQAISAIDQALWIRAAEHAGVVLSRLLGGDPLGEIPVYGSSLGPNSVAESAERCVELGLRAAKVKLGFGLETDARNLRLAREVLGADVRLFGDANQGWSPEEAVEVAPLLADAGVEWIEEPIRGDAPGDHAELFARTGMPIATGENLYGAEAFAPYVREPAVHLVQPDVGKVGGVTEYQRIVALASETATLVAPHLYNGAYATAVSLQLAAANRTTPWLEWDIRQNPVREPIDHLLTPRGTVAVPDAPGLGVEIDVAPLASHLVHHTQEAQ